MKIYIETDIERPSGIDDDELQGVVRAALLDLAYNNFVAVNDLTVSFEFTPDLDRLMAEESPFTGGARKRPTLLRRLVGARA